MSRVQVTVPAAVSSSATRPHERPCVSPDGTQVPFAVSHSLPFSQTASRSRSSFVWSSGGDRPACGSNAGTGSWSTGIPGVATSCTWTSGGVPVTVRRWTTCELGLSTETTYWVAVAESACTGVRLE